MNFLSFFYWTTEFLLFLSRKRKKKGTHRKSFIYLKDFSFVVNFFFLFLHLFVFLCVWVLGTWSCRKSPIRVTRWQDLCLRAGCIKAEIRRNCAQSPNARCETWLWHERVRSALVKIHGKKISFFSESCISCFHRPRKRTMRIVTSR